MVISDKASMCLACMPGRYPVFSGQYCLISFLMTLLYCMVDFCWHCLIFPFRKTVHKMLHFLNKLAWGKIEAVPSLLIPSFLFSLSFHPFPSPPRTMSLKNVLAVQVICCSLFSKVLYFLFKMGFHVAQDSLKFVM